MITPYPVREEYADLGDHSGVVPYEGWLESSGDIHLASSGDLPGIRGLRPEHYVTKGTL